MGEQNNNSEFWKKLEKEIAEEQEARKEYLPKLEQDVQKLKSRYEVFLEESPGDALRAKRDLVEGIVALEELKERIRRCADDPSKRHNLSELELKELERRVMQDLGYPEDELKLFDEYIEYLKQKNQP
ncbi:MAG: hypothetical protein KBC81_03680 [Candidatus Pacebacteria bacterium]|nr:hypothetical protein [Candidatus Paceibacterota bacterium]